MSLVPLMSFMNFSHLLTLPAGCYQEAEIHQWHGVGQSKSSKCCSKMVFSQFIPAEYLVQSEFTILMFPRSLHILSPHRPGLENRKWLMAFIKLFHFLSQCTNEVLSSSSHRWEIRSFAFDYSSRDTKINLFLREELLTISSLFWKVQWYRWTGIITPLPQSREDALSRWFRRFITPLPRLAAHNLTSFPLLLCWANEKNSFEILLKVTKWKQKTYVRSWIIYWKQIAKWPWAGTLIGVTAHGITSFLPGHLNSATHSHLFSSCLFSFHSSKSELKQVIAWRWWNQMLTSATILLK